MSKPENTPLSLTAGRKAAGVLVVERAGDGLDRSNLPNVAAVAQELAGGGAYAMECDAKALGRWDSALLVRVLALSDLCAKGKIEFRALTLPEGLAKLFALSQAVPEKADAARKEVTQFFLQRVADAGPSGLDRRRGEAELVGRERAGPGSAARRRHRLTHVHD